ncbi:MAG: putative nucleic acid-binding protein [Cryomorphaceae bacterium]|jgi:predicted nucleic acid-binding protein
MNVFLDSNILLDVVLEREPFYEQSLLVMEWCIKNSSSTHIAWHTVTNCLYILRKDLGTEQTIAVLSSLLEWVEIAPSSKTLAQQGLKNAGKYFEDTLQYLCAESAKCEYLITRNPKDFKNSTVSVYTPSEFITALID